MSISWRSRLAGAVGRWWRRRHPAAAVAGALLAAGGASAVGVAASAQVHAPQPTAAQAGTLGPSPKPSRREAPQTAPAGRRAAISTPVIGPVLARSMPISIAIPAIGVHSTIQRVGLNPDGTIEVPPLNRSPRTNEAAWYEYSPTPGQPGPSIIEGHVDSAAQGPSVFFRLGDVELGDTVDVTLADGTVAVFRVDGVREYAKTQFPTASVYGHLPYAGLRLITCGGSFDQATRHYRSNIVVYATLVS